MLAGLMRCAVTQGSTLTYYVSAAGSDSANGLTPATAFASISKANAMATSPRTVVLFRGGDTFSGTITVGADNLTYGSYGTGRAIISAGTAEGLSATNRAGLTVQNLNFQGTAINSGTSSGLHIINSQAGNTKLSGPTLRNVDTFHFGDCGVLIEGTTGTSGFTGIVLDNVNAYENTGGQTTTRGASGIQIMGVQLFAGTFVPAHTNVSITNCTAYGNTGNLAVTANWTGSGIFVSEVQDCLIQGNLAYNNGANSNASNGPVGIFAYDSDRVTIRYNESHHNLTNGTYDGGGFDLDAGVTNSVMEYNYSHDNYGPGLMIYSYAVSAWGASTNNVIRFNISENDGLNIGLAPDQAGIMVSSDQSVTGAEIYGNTVYQSNTSRNCLSIAGGNASSTTAKIANNLFIGGKAVKCTANPAGVVLRGNDYYKAPGLSIDWNSSAYTTLAAFRTATGQEKSGGTDYGYSVNPILLAPGTDSASGLRLGLSSPAVGIGIDLPTFLGHSVPALDYFGNTVPNASGTGYNIGAFGAVASVAKTYSTLAKFNASDKNASITLSSTDHKATQAGSTFSPIGVRALADPVVSGAWAIGFKIEALATGIDYASVPCLVTSTRALSFGGTYPGDDTTSFAVFSGPGTGGGKYNAVATDAGNLNLPVGAGVVIAWKYVSSDTWKVWYGTQATAGAGNSVTWVNGDPVAGTGGLTVTLFDAVPAWYGTDTGAAGSVFALTSPPSGFTSYTAVA